jgi:hypothetical protein
MLMIMASMLAHAVDVKGAFLHGEFEDGKIIHMKVLQRRALRSIFLRGVSYY